MSDAASSDSMSDDPTFDFTDEQWEAVIDFVMHYDAEYRHPTSGWGRAQRALIRRMMLDIGIQFDVVYDCASACADAEKERR